MQGVRHRRPQKGRWRRGCRRQSHSRSGSFSRPSRSRNPSTSSKPRSPSASPAGRTTQKKLQEDLDRLRTRIEEKTAKIEAMESQEKSIQDKLQKSKKLKQDTDVALNTARRHKSDIDTEVKNLKKDRDSLQKKITELKCKKSAIDARKKDDDDAAAPALCAQQEVNKLNNTATDLRATLTKLGADKRALETILAAHNIEVTTQKTCLHDINQQLTQAATKLRRTKEETIAASNELHTINNAITQARAAFEEEQTARQHQMTTTDTQIAELQQHLAALQTQYDSQNQEMTATINTLKAETIELKKEKNLAAESLSNTLSSNSASLQSSAIQQSNALNAELDTVRNKVGAAKMRLTQVTNDLTRATQDLQSTQREIDSKQTERANANDSLNITKSQLELESKKLHDVLQALDSTKSNHTHSSTALANARAELTRVTNDLKATTDQLNMTHTEHQAVYGQLQEAKSNLRDIKASITSLRRRSSPSAARGRTPRTPSPTQVPHHSLMMEYDDTTDAWISPKPQGIPVTPGKNLAHTPTSMTQTVTVNPTINVQNPANPQQDTNVAQQAAAFFAQAGKDLTTYVQSEIGQSQKILSQQVQAMNATIADMKSTALQHFEVQKATYAQHFNELEAMQASYNKQKDTEAAIQIGQLKESLTEEFKATRQVDLIEPQIAKQQTQITLLQNALKEIDRMLKTHHTKKPPKNPKKTNQIADKQSQIATQLEIPDLQPGDNEDALAQNQSRLYQTINHKIDDQHARVTRVMDDLRNDIHDPQALFSVNPKTIAQKRPHDASTDTTIGKPPLKMPPKIDVSRVPPDHLASVESTLAKLQPQQLQPGTQVQVQHDTSHTEPLPQDS